MCAANRFDRQITHREPHLCKKHGNSNSAHRRRYTHEPNGYCCEQGTKRRKQIENGMRRYHRVVPKRMLVYESFGRFSPDIDISMHDLYSHSSHGICIRKPANRIKHYTLNKIAHSNQLTRSVIALHFPCGYRMRKYVMFCADNSVRNRIYMPRVWPALILCQIKITILNTWALHTGFNHIWFAVFVYKFKSKNTVSIRL